jgi:outer membrane protein
MNASVPLVSLVLMLSAAPLLAQTAPTPSGQQPAAPGAQAAPQPAPQPPAPFPQGAKVAYVNLQAIMQGSADGKAAAARLQAETKKRSAEAEVKMKQMQANQQKLQTGGSLMSAEARVQLESEIQKQQRDGERYEQDAQAELNEMQKELQQAYNEKLFPVLEQLTKEKGLSLLFSVADSGLIWAEPGLDLTLEAIKKMDGLPTPPRISGAAAPATAKPGTPPPAAAPPKPTTPPPATAKPPAGAKP